MYPISKSEQFYLVYINVARKSIDIIDNKSDLVGVEPGAKYGGIPQLIVSWL